MNQYYEDLLIDALLDFGFSLDEAQRLISLQERVERERREEQIGHNLVSWAYGSDIKSILN